MYYINFYFILFFAYFICGIIEFVAQEVSQEEANLLLQASPKIKQSHFCKTWNIKEKKPRKANSKEQMPLHLLGLVQQRDSYTAESYYQPCKRHNNVFYAEISLW